VPPETVDVNGLDLPTCTSTGLGEIDTESRRFTVTVAVLDVACIPRLSVTLT
jgi:hypothetical protein